MHHPITIAKIKNQPQNRTFFGNAGFHGDRSYYVNEARMELTVKMEVDGMKRQATYRIEWDGGIGELLAH